MPTLPRIETTDPDQALIVCQDILAFVEATAYDLTEGAAAESSNAVYTSVAIWNGVCLLTKLVKNTLTDIEHSECQPTFKTKSSKGQQT